MSSDPSGSNRFRPHYHFVPPTGWINDPNGLVWYDGEYHLFCQHHPYSPIHGPMHWLHAVSEDLVHWTDLPIALYPDHNGMIFSGSATVDTRNSAGFGKDALIAVFTSHDSNSTPIQRQSIAWSTDRGRTFTAYEGNPVLFPPPNTRDFRDPRVLWYGSPESGYWVLVLAVGDEAQFFRSDDLKTWTQTGTFGRGHGAHGGVWECPDLFPLPIEGEEEQRWVLVIGLNPGGQALGSGTQYFVGNFDGATFVSENAPETTLWLDWGADAYATQSWDSEPNGRRIITSWLNNWHYARVTPTGEWRGSIAFPRELSLRRTQEGLRVFQQPVHEIVAAHGPSWSLAASLVDGESTLDAEPLSTIDLQASFAGIAADHVGIVLRDGLRGVLTIGWDNLTQQVWVDRSASGIVDFHPDFAARHRAPLGLVDGALHLRVLIDANSVELFANEGRVAISDVIYPHEGKWTISLFAEGGSAEGTLSVNEVVA